MKEKIQKALVAIEQEEQVRVLFACESGSRAWGFPSSDSDYDVRFLYIHPRVWYLAINLERSRDVIERPIEDGLDFRGWDLRKALQLYKKSNPPLMEWLGSPIVYSEKYATAEKLRNLAPKFYSPYASIYHYLHMAQGIYREYMKGDKVRIKKYFYLLRPLLAIQWIERDLGVVPTEFDVLVDKLVKEEKLKMDIKKLIDEKRAGMELDRRPKILSISKFIANEINRLEGIKYEFNFTSPETEELNILFRETLDEVLVDFSAAMGNAE